MKWLAELKKKSGNDESYDRGTGKYISATLLEDEEFDRLIEIAEEAEIALFEDSRGNDRCPICGAIDEDGKIAHHHTCPYSDEWVKS